jgi:hypothetical protein
LCEASAGPSRQTVPEPGKGKARARAVFPTHVGVNRPVDKTQHVKLRRLASAPKKVAHVNIGKDKSSVWENSITLWTAILGIPSLRSRRHRSHA